MPPPLLRRRSVYAANEKSMGPTVEGCGGWCMYGAQEAKLSENVGTEPTELEIA